MPFGSFAVKDGNRHAGLYLLHYEDNDARPLGTSNRLGRCAKAGVILGCQQGLRMQQMAAKLLPVSCQRFFGVRADLLSRKVSGIKR